MKHPSGSDRIDPRVFAQSSGRLAGTDVLARYGRILQECEGRGAEVPVSWLALGELREAAPGQHQVWLHLRVDATLPMVCQRCLDQVEVPLSVDRSFRFVADEATAAAQDDDVEEDLLVLAAEFELQQLVEDELLLALPLIARHDVCPGPVRLTAADPGFDAAAPERPNPFGQLARLKRDQGGGTK